MPDYQGTKNALDNQSASTPFADLTTVDRTPLIGISSDFPLSEQQDEWTSGVTHIKPESEIRMRANASTESLETIRYVPYEPGYKAEVGISLRIPETPTGDQEVRWGYWDGEHGTYWGYDADGLYIEFVRDGVPQDRVRMENWNGEDIDAETVLQEGVVSRLGLSLYNHGEVTFELFPRSEKNRQERRILHADSPRGQTTLSRQNLPPRVEVSNPSADDFDVFVADRQAALRGAFSPDRRSKGEFRTSVALDGTTWVPLVSFRRKPDFRGVNIEVLSLSLITQDDLILQLRSGADLTGADWGAPSLGDENETAAEWDRSATAGDVSSGFLRWGPEIAPGGQGNRTGLASLDDVDVRLKADRPMTLFARRVSGTGGEVSIATLRAQEQW